MKMSTNSLISCPQNLQVLMHGSTNFTMQSLEMYIVLLSVHNCSMHYQGMQAFPILTFCHHSICALTFTCPIYFFLSGLGGQSHVSCCTYNFVAGGKHNRFVYTECCVVHAHIRVIDIDLTYYGSTMMDDGSTGFGCYTESTSLMIFMRVNTSQTSPQTAN